MPEWRVTTCGCSAEPGGCSYCCKALFCGPCVYGSIVSEFPPTTDVPCAGNCCCACTLFTLLGGIIPMFGTSTLAGYLLCFTRNATRHERGIPGSACDDLCCSTFCGPCAMSQLLIETRTPVPKAKMGTRFIAPECARMNRIKHVN